MSAGTYMEKAKSCLAIDLTVVNIDGMDLFDFGPQLVE